MHVPSLVTLALAAAVAISMTPTIAGRHRRWPSRTGPRSRAPASIRRSRPAAQVVVTNYDKVCFYKKDGTPITNVNGPSQAALPIYIRPSSTRGTPVSPNLNDT
jgi:hypothetical protein